MYNLSNNPSPPSAIERKNMCRVCKGIGRVYSCMVFIDSGTTDCATRPLFIVCTHCEGTGREPWFTIDGKKMLER